MRRPQTLIMKVHKGQDKIKKVMWEFKDVGN